MGFLNKSPSKEILEARKARRIPIEERLTKASKEGRFFQQLARERGASLEWTSIWNELGQLEERLAKLEGEET